VFSERDEASSYRPLVNDTKSSVNVLQNDGFKNDMSCQKGVTNEPAVFNLFLIKIFTPNMIQTDISI
jgi:hypothetical protein